MGMFAKLMSRITESSLMDEQIEVRYTFMMLLAIADPHGYVVGTDVAIARRINMPLEDFQRCVLALMQPDPNSNSMEEEGRRVIMSDCERGYFLVNYRKYRDTRDEEHRREYMREYMRKKRNDNDVTPVNSCKQRKQQLANAEGDGDEEAKGEKKQRKPVVFSEPVFPAVLDTPQFKEWWNKYVQYRKASRFKALLPSSVELQLNKLAAVGHDSAIETIKETISNQWRGLFPKKITVPFAQPSQPKQKQYVMTPEERAHFDKRQAEIRRQQEEGWKEMAE